MYSSSYLCASVLHTAIKQDYLGEHVRMHWCTHKTTPALPLQIHFDISRHTIWQTDSSRFSVPNDTTVYSKYLQTQMWEDPTEWSNRDGVAAWTGLSVKQWSVCCSHPNVPYSRCNVSMKLRFGRKALMILGLHILSHACFTQLVYKHRSHMKQPFAWKH